MFLNGGFVKIYFINIKNKQVLWWAFADFSDGLYDKFIQLVETF